MKVKWFFAGLVISRSGENGQARCGFPGAFLADGSSFWGMAERYNNTFCTPLDTAGCWVSVLQPLLSCQAWGHEGHPTSVASPWLFELKIQPCSTPEVKQIHGMVWLGRDLNSVIPDLGKFPSQGEPFSGSK